MSARHELCTVDGDGVVDDAELHAEILGDPSLLDLVLVRDDHGRTEAEKLAIALLEKGYNPDQPRDERGRFSSGGSGAASGVEVPSREDQAKSAADLKSYADMVAKIQPRGTDAIIAANGKPYHFDEDSFSGSKKTQGLCYQEAGRAALDKNFTYVEGYVSVHGVPIHHAWVVDSDGRVHDPTLQDGRGVHGYFGVPFKTNYVRETILRTGMWGMFDYHNPKIYDDAPSEYVAKFAGGSVDILDRAGIFKFDPSQARDAQGKFTSGGGVKASLKELYSDSLGIARRDMPQVPEKFKAQFVDELRADGVGVTREEVDAGTLKATQGEYNPTAIQQVRDNRAGSTDVKDNPIVVSSDDRVLDGHHRWAAAAQDGDRIKVVRVDLPIKDLLSRAREFNDRLGIEARKYVSPWDVIEVLSLGDKWVSALDRAGIFKFSDDQPRDDHGRFAPGGTSSSSGPSTGSHPIAPPNRDYSSIRDASGRTAGELLSSGAGRDEIEVHPALVQARADQDAVPHTDSYHGYGTKEFRDSRTFNGVVGYDTAVDHLAEVAKSYAGPGGVKNDHQATIILGLPASGKSTFAEKIASDKGAAIVDPDDAKKLFVEYGTGIGANSVHEESSLISKAVLKQFTDQGANLILPKVGAGIDSIRGTTAALKSAGYSVNLALKDADEGEAYGKAVRRFLGTGRLISGNYMNEVDSKPGRVYRALADSGEYASTEVY